MDPSKIPTTKAVVLEAKAFGDTIVYLRLYPFAMPENRFQVIAVSKFSGVILFFEFWASLEMAQKAWLQTANAYAQS